MDWEKEWQATSNELFDITEHFLEQGFELAKESTTHPIKIYRQDGSGGRPTRFVTEFTVTGVLPEAAFKEFYAEKRLQWDKNLTTDTCVLKEITDDVGIHRNATHSAAGGLISGRDFVDLCAVERRDGGIIIQSGHSIEYDGCPPSKEYTRGHNHCSGVVVYPRGEKECLFRYVVCTDLKGWLPRRLVEGATTDALVKLLGVFIDFLAANQDRLNQKAEKKKKKKRSKSKSKE